MLPSAVRMRASAEFSDTVAHGVRCAAGPIVVHLRVPPTAPAASPHAGLVVSRAVGNAVVRHRVARRLRHLLADRVSAFPPGTQLVVRALPGAAQADSATLGAALDRALARAAQPSSAASTASVAGTRR